MESSPREVSALFLDIHPRGKFLHFFLVIPPPREIFTLIFAIPLWVHFRACCEVYKKFSYRTSRQLNSCDVYDIFLLFHHTFSGFCDEFFQFFHIRHTCGRRLSFFLAIPPRGKFRRIFLLYHTRRHIPADFLTISFCC